MSGRAKALALVAIVVLVVGFGYLLTAGDRPETTSGSAPATEPVVQPAPAAPATAPAPAPRAPTRDMPAPPSPTALPSVAAPADASIPTRAAPLPESAAERTAKINAASYQTESMEMLRQLVETDPERAIEIARVGNRRFPKRPEAAERSWIVVKGLSNLKRFEEARDEVRLMQQRYPGNKFALDAEQHLKLSPASGDRGAAR
jgi:hypothetical protein